MNDDGGLIMSLFCRITLSLGLLLLLSPVHVSAQNNEWMVWPSLKEVQAFANGKDRMWVGRNTGLAHIAFASGMVVDYPGWNTALANDNVHALLVDASGNLWIGSDGGGLAMFDGTDWVFYTTDNSSLPTNYIRALATDSSGVLWVGTWGDGLVSFDGSTWTVYTEDNSGLGGNVILSIVWDALNRLWVGTDEGLSLLDGANWTVYTPDNSPLPGWDVQALVVDSAGVAWVGTDNGLVLLDGVNWTVYDKDNSPLPDDEIRALALDILGRLWIGTRRGLVLLDGTNWMVYTPDNAPLPDDEINALALDTLGHVWIGTREGVVAFREGGVVVRADDARPSSAYALTCCYPNPASEWAIAAFTLNEGRHISLKLYDLSGRERSTLAKGMLSEGYHRIRFSVGDLASGVYLIHAQIGNSRVVKNIVVLR